MADKSNFEIKVPYEGEPIPMKIDFVAARGIAVESLGSVGGDSILEGQLASEVGGFVGFLTRAVSVAGEVGTVLNSIYGGRLEGDFKKGELARVERADAFEAEGSDYLHEGDAEAIGAGTALGTGLNFKAGKIKIAAEGEKVYYVLSAKDLTPVTDGNTRIRCDIAR